jgi:hypothetical protein
MLEDADDKLVEDFTWVGVFDGRCIVECERVYGDRAGLQRFALILTHAEPRAYERLLACPSKRCASSMRINYTANRCNSSDPSPHSLSQQTTVTAAVNAIDPSL